MNTDKNLITMITEEFKGVLKLCSESKSLEDQIYYFSACYGVVRRIMNIQCNPTLVLMHHILQNAHQAFSQRAKQPSKQDVISSQFPLDIWISFLNLLPKLLKAIEDNDDNKVREVLENMNYHSYATTGNGYYLYLRNQMIFDKPIQNKIVNSPNGAEGCIE